MLSLACKKTVSFNSGVTGFSKAALLGSAQGFNYYVSSANHRLDCFTVSVDSSTGVISLTVIVSNMVFITAPQDVDFVLYD